MPTDQSTQSRPFGTFGIPPADSASRAGGMPKASGIGDWGRSAKKYASLQFTSTPPYSAPHRHQ